jgi:Protein of unknown function (DUF4231)
MATKRRTGSDRQKDEFSDVIESLELDQIRKQFITSRWLDQYVWLSRKADRAQRAYYTLRLITVAGAVLLPALLSVNPENESLDLALRVGTWVVSLVVAVSAAVEQLFRFGERWRIYRNTAEGLKTEGWLYFQRAGPYAGEGMTHEAAYPAFAGRVEELLQSDVQAYLKRIATEKQREASQPG